MGLCENMDSLVHIWLELTFFSGGWLGDISNIRIIKNITSIQFTICLYYQGMFKLSVVIQRKENSDYQSQALHTWLLEAALSCCDFYAHWPCIVSAHLTLLLHPQYPENWKVLYLV